MWLHFILECLHKGVGYATCVVAILSIYMGMDELRKLYSHSFWYIAAYSTFLICLLIVAIELKIVSIFVFAARSKQQPTKKQFIVEHNNM